MIKKFEAESKYKSYDADGDGVVSDEELARAKEFTDMELREEKAEAQKRMAWVAIIAMCAYPLISLLIPESKLQTWGSMSDMIFLSQASIVGMYFGAQAYMSRK
ncbi:MAG: hypothetical protein CMK29_01940 [Porticoccaceae bacterium]|nr:hypothetical protein [Porticoccaceae bacterium]